ncbi:MAG TPA: serine/threonine protein kinase [Oscillatoriaceae cyanobacterium M33_DOE_052]|uniref:Protein kinase domain-containing protein n=1 Tax=Planktothricoides sp. SpSt-374 TaxID=2282167 RepID=A0A7C3ZKI1_9CYAN|nr:serine/threonine protein kinase [Oscillatoriaceae cyanobacterium M33_DOE_052]
MSYCINPKCPKPADPLNAQNRICRHCGSALFIQGRYRATRLLGEGGFAKTFEVEERGTPKVLKVLQLRQAKAVSLFQREAHVLQKLRHPGIPRVEAGDYFTFSPRHSATEVHCLVMQKIEGCNLEEWLSQRQHRPISQRQALDWLRQLTEILREIHSHQYFHRDIKPTNIMLQPGGKLALIDFGSVRQVSGTYLAKMGVGHQGTIIASKGYAPPEQENGHPVPQSDFFALGRTFVHLLTARHPLEFYDAFTDELRWRQAAPHISPELADFIDYLTQRLPGQRPQNTQVIFQCLGAIERSGQKSRPPNQGRFGGMAQAHHQLPKASHPKVFSWKMPLLALSGLVLLPGLAWTQVKIYPYLSSIMGSESPPKSAQSPPKPRIATAAIPISAAPKVLSPQIAPTKTLAGHSQQVRSVAFSPDGQTLASSSIDGTIKLWDIAKGNTRQTLKVDTAPGEMVYSLLAISPDGEILASNSGSRGSIEIWNLKSGKSLQEVQAQTAGVAAIAISPNGEILATGSPDGTIQLWNLPGGTQIKSFSLHIGPVQALAISPDGKTLATGFQNGSIKLSPLNPGNDSPPEDNQEFPNPLLLGHVNNIHSVAFSPDGKILASGSADNTIKLWDVTTGKLRHSLSSNQGIIYSVSFSGDGKMLASGSSSGQIQLWNVATGAAIKNLPAHSGLVESVAFSPDGRTLASASADKTIKIWALP